MLSLSKGLQTFLITIAKLCITDATMLLKINIVKIQEKQDQNPALIFLNKIFCACIPRIAIFNYLKFYS